MSLDHAFMLLADKDNLRAGKHASKTMSSLEALNYTAKDGLIHGRTGDGKPMVGKVTGKSLCRRLMEEAEAKAAEEKRLRDLAAANPPKRRRRNRG